MWSIYRYDILNMKRLLILGFMRRVSFELLYGGQTMGIMIVF